MIIGVNIHFAGKNAKTVYIKRFSIMHSKKNKTIKNLVQEI